jgi:hypothetical protein
MAFASASLRVIVWVLNSTALPQVLAKYGRYLLPMALQEWFRADRSETTNSVEVPDRAFLLGLSRLRLRQAENNRSRVLEPILFSFSLTPNAAIMFFGSLGCFNVQYFRFGTPF